MGVGVCPCVCVYVSCRYRLVVDESYSFGVLGASGRGAIEHWGLKQDDVRPLNTDTHTHTQTKTHTGTLTHASARGTAHSSSVHTCIEGVT